MSQERRKKLILKPNPPLRFMADDHKNFTNTSLMLFGECFIKQATTMVEQVKAIKKLHIPQKKKSRFSTNHPRSYQNSHEGGGKSGRARYQLYKPVIRSIASCQAKNTRTINCCTLSKRKSRFSVSPYFKFKCSTALSSEGHSNKFACWPSKSL